MPVIDQQTDGPELDCCPTCKRPRLPRTYPTSEFAKLFHVKPKTVERWAKRGKVRPLEVRGKELIFSESEYLRVINSKRTVVFA